MGKFIFVIFAVAALLGVLGVAETDAAMLWGHWGWWYGGEKSPALAAGLSLLPPPIALGQFYAEDWRKGLIFSAAETALATTAIGVLVYEYSDPMQRGKSIREWEETSQAVFVSAVGGYIATKFFDAYIAALSAEEYNAKLRGSLELSPDGRRLGLSLDYPF
ncbi:MAG: hypothetical protein ACUVXI_02090 [bacterium]